MVWCFLRTRNVAGTYMEIYHTVSIPKLLRKGYGKSYYTVLENYFNFWDLIIE